MSKTGQGQRYGDEATLIEELAEGKLQGKPGVGLVVGVIRGSHQNIYTLGHSGNPRRKRLDEHSIFEIGSLTKLITGILLAKLVQRHLLRLRDCLAHLLPASVKLRGRVGAITLHNLAVHRSGLPCIPKRIARLSGENPYARYTTDDLYRYLSAHRLRHAPGSRHLYSNLGFGVLGHLLALRLETSYEQAVLQEVCQPLGLNDTGIVVPAAKRQRFTQGHDADGHPVSSWDLPAVEGAGALRSTVSDMLTFLAANMGLADTPLAAAIALAHKSRAKTRQRGLFSTLGWYVRKRRPAMGNAAATGAHEVFYHYGRTGGCSSFAGFGKEQQVGVVALTNSHLDSGLAATGQELLARLLGTIGPCRS
jgi:CubicO group peptidase (beta-lactamase class C family)